MTTLNARANQAWHEWLDSEAGDGMESVGAYAFEEAWEIGYKARQLEMPTREQIEQRVRRVYIDGGAHVVHAQEAASEIAGALLSLLKAPS